MPGSDGTESGQTGTAASPSPIQTPQPAMFHQILSPQHLDLKSSGEIAENWKLWKEKYNNYFVISRLDQESADYQLLMLTHAIGDEGLKIIKTFTYTDGEDQNDWRVVMDKMEKHCIGKVNEIYKR